MDREPDRVAWLALLVVDEAAEAAEADWIKGSVGLRLALAYLYSIADGPTFELPSRRSTFDTFWETVTKRHDSGNPKSAAYARSSMVSSCLQQIGRQTRFGANIFNAVREARSPERTARGAIAEALRLSGEEEARKKWRKRQGYFGRPYPGDRKPEDQR